MAETILGKVCPTPKGVYNATAKYEKLDIIQHDGNGYMVLKECTGVLPSESEYYMLLSARGSDGAKGADGTDGAAGADGKSAYQAAVEAGYTGTETEFATLMNSIANKQDKIIGTIGQVVGFDSMGLPHAAHWWINKNLLINADFRKPVNQDGKTVYSAAGCTIDKWKNETNSGALTVNDASVTFSWNRADSSIHAALTQSIDRRKDLLGKVCTWSMLARGTGTINLSAGDENNGRLLINLTDEPTLYTITVPLVTLEFLGGLSHWRIVADGEYCSLTGEIEMFAVKLEEGSVQTLAHKDSNNNWVINDPIDYDLQYALCSLYSPINNDRWVGDQRSNPQMLHNAFWAHEADIINQRGYTVYTTAAAPESGQDPNTLYGRTTQSYTIDRWKLNVANSSISITPNGIQLTSGSMYGGIYQQSEGNLGIRPGDTVTISALFHEINPGWYIDLHVTEIVPGENVKASGRTLLSHVITETETNILLSTTVVIPENYVYSDKDVLRFFICNNKESGAEPCTVVAAKMEKGSVQTLAHQDADGNWVLNDFPDHLTEYLRCRYFLRVWRGKPNYNITFGHFRRYANNNCIIAVPINSPMRCNPVLLSWTKLDIRLKGHSYQITPDMISNIACTNGNDNIIIDLKFTNDAATSFLDANSIEINSYSIEALITQGTELILSSEV